MSSMSTWSHPGEFTSPVTVPLASVTQVLGAGKPAVPDPSQKDAFHQS